MSTHTLDEQYRVFRDISAPTFAAFPQIEPLRYFIFRHLLVEHRTISWKDVATVRISPLLRRRATQLPKARADVIVWIENCSDSVLGTLSPIYDELGTRGVSVQAMASEVADEMPPATIHFRYSWPMVLPAWARHAWQHLTNDFPSLAQSGLWRTFAHMCQKLEGRYRELNRLLDAIQPRVILSASIGLIGGAALMVEARKRHILTLEIQHGLTQVFFTPLLADLFLAWGASSTEHLVNLGLPSDRVLSLGSPRHDQMHPRPNFDARAVLCQRLNLPNRPTLVYFSNGNDLRRNGHAPAECAKWLQAVAAQYANKANIVVRLHPKEGGDLYRNCSNLRVSKGIPDLSTTLQGCDAAASLCSTVMYEALLFSRPVWQLYADGWPELADNWKHGLATRIASMEQLSDMVAGLDASAFPNQKNALTDKVFANSGRAACSVVEFVQTRIKGV